MRVDVILGGWGKMWLVSGVRQVGLEMAKQP